MKVSVIVPIYNAEKTLERILNSLMSQTLKDFEVLMINDGSNDSSGIICESYAKKDSRFKAIHKVNGGVSSARQIGIERATGEYIIHADSDDWVEQTMLEELYNEAINKKADIVICDYFVNYKNGQHYVNQKPENLNQQNIQNELFGKLHGSCCNKLVKRKCIEDYNIKFIQDVNYCEDLLFWLEILNYPLKISYLNKAFYHYYYDIDNKSIMGNYNMSFFNTSCKVVELINNILPNEIRDINVRKFKISIKCGAFEHPIFTSKQYYNIYPEVNKYLWSDCKTSLVNKALIFLSYHGFYHLSTWLYSKKNKLKGRTAR